MKKLFLTLLSNILIIVLGLVTIISPQFLNYINENKFYFNFVKFLNDNPKLRFPVSIFLLICGFIGIVFSIMQNISDKTTYVIQKGKKSDFGSLDLSFPSFVNNKTNSLIYTNLASTGSNTKAILDLEKENLKNFYSSINKSKKISFLSISLFPFIVYAGYCIGKSGQKVTLYHYDRKKSKSKKIRWNFKNTNQIISDGVIEGGKSKTICISISYEIDKSIVEQEFNNSTIQYFKTEHIGTEEIKNKRDIDLITSQIRKIISEQSNEVNLLLSCPSELCFAIGQELNSPGLPLIKIYNYNVKDKNHKWNWCIYLN